MKKLFIISLCVLIVGCVSNKASIASLPKLTNEDPSEIIFIRKDKFIGSAIRTIVAIDGIDVGEMRNKHILSAQLNSGTHVLSLLGHNSTSTYSKSVALKQGEKRLFWLKPDFPQAAVIIPLLGISHDYFVLEEIPLDELRKNTDDYAWLNAKTGE
jgi:hypothetical protein